MANFFSMTALYGTAKNAYAHPILTERGAMIERLKWVMAVEKSKSFSAAMNVPINFTPLWSSSPDAKEQKADWPFNMFLLPVCSLRMWAIMEPFCPGMGWIQLPDDDQGNPMPWGAIAPCPIVDLHKAGVISRDFFLVAQTTGKKPIYAVSLRLKIAIEKASLVGVSFESLF